MQRNVMPSKRSESVLGLSFSSLPDLSLPDVSSAAAFLSAAFFLVVVVEGAEALSPEALAPKSGVPPTPTMARTTLAVIARAASVREGARKGAMQDAGLAEKTGLVTGPPGNMRRRITPSARREPTRARGPGSGLRTARVCAMIRAYEVTSFRPQERPWCPYCPR